MSGEVMYDVYSGAGGAGMGYKRAGFARVIGIDNRPQPRYPFEFVQADALEVLDAVAAGREPWPGAPRPDAIHASPPCQDHSRSHKPLSHGTGWMLDATRIRLRASGLPWVIENVPGAPMRADYKLCGCMFGLKLPAGAGQLARERWFEASWRPFEMRPPCHHPDPIITVSGNGAGVSHQKVHCGFAEWRQLMGIDWMTGIELSQAIPPAYTEHVGRDLIELLTSERAA